MKRLLIGFFLGAFFGARAAEPEKRLLGAMPAAEFEAEVLQASDITLTQAAGTLRLNRGATEAALTLGFGTLAIDYAPVAFDLFGSARGRKETALSAQLALRHRAGPRLELLGSLGARDGFDSFRALWLDEYFRQRFEGRPGYRSAQPRGAAFSGGARWEYQLASGFVQLGYARSQDDVAPGYEIDFTGLRRGAETLVTDTVTLGFENVLTERLRTRVELRVATTSEREPRYGAEISARYALGERWIVRADAGASDERPTFRAQYGGAELEFSATETFAIFFGAQLYRDTGEIENALLFTSAAPGCARAAPISACAATANVCRGVSPSAGWRATSRRPTVTPIFFKISTAIARGSPCAPPPRGNSKRLPSLPPCLAPAPASPSSFSPPSHSPPLPPAPRSIARVKSCRILP